MCQIVRTRIRNILQNQGTERNTIGFVLKYIASGTLILKSFRNAPFASIGLMSALRSSLISAILRAAAALLSMLWTAFFIWGRQLSTADWARLLPGFEGAELAFGPSPEGWVPKVVAATLAILSGLLAAIWVLVRHFDAWQRFWDRPDLRTRFIGFAIASGCVCILMYNMLDRTTESPWSSVKVILTNPSSVEIWGQRLLLLWPAMLFKYLVPRLSYIQAFILAQFIGIVLSIYAMGLWSALFIGERLKFLGQILLTLLLLPTMIFYQAHDIGVVFTHTFCFLFLYKRQYWLYCLMFCLAVFNHQNIMLMIPAAIFLMWGRESRSTVAWVAIFSIAAYLSGQVILNQLVPIPKSRHDKIWWNMRLIVEMHRSMIFGLMLTIPWYAAAAAAFRTAEPFLKRATILLPFQLAVYVVYGQLNESRLFHGFLPVLIGIFLCYLRDRFRESGIPPLRQDSPAYNVAG